MTKKYFTIIFFSFFTAVSYAQFNYQRIWGTYYCGNQSNGYFLKTDHDGNKYIIGEANDLSNIENNAYFLQFTTANAHQQTFNYSSSLILKISPSGDIIWCTYFGLDIESTTSQFDQITDIAFDSDNNVYVIGSIDGFQGQGIITEPADFSLSSVQRKGFISKFTQAGVQLWGKWVPFYPSKVVVDTTDGLYISGFTDATDLPRPGYSSRII